MEPESLINLAMKEYEMLRTEILSTVERQYSLANWGVSSVAVIIAAIVAGWATLTSIPGVMSVILLFIIPAVMTVYVVSWSHVITKIKQLGARLHEIEENVAAAIHPELIRRTYGLPPEGDLNPYKFTVGWEHKLWENGVNLRVKTTIKVVRLALAVIYTSFIVLNAFLLVHYQKMHLHIIWSISIVSGVFWALIWFLTFQYLHRRTRE